MRVPWRNAAQNANARIPANTIAPGQHVRCGSDGDAVGICSLWKTVVSSVTWPNATLLSTNVSAPPPISVPATVLHAAQCRSMERLAAANPANDSCADDKCGCEREDDDGVVGDRQ